MSSFPLVYYLSQIKRQSPIVWILLELYTSKFLSRDALDGKDNSIVSHTFMECYMALFML